jgi:hypothetical protein
VTLINSTWQNPCKADTRLANQDIPSHLPARRFVFCSTDFDPEDGGDTLLRNVGSYTDCTALYPRRWQLSSFVQISDLNSACISIPLRMLHAPAISSSSNHHCNNTWPKLPTNKKTPWLQSTSELYRPSDRRLSAKLVPIVSDRGVARSRRSESLRP